ncbi:MAG: hypothetical protein EOP62_21935 [Sphingomonadales bacterium]|nr:MAG: hypothetical protein EOP62_21935 [Sphingomonadales bacterium]
MTAMQFNDRAEPIAKAGLLEFLRSRGSLTRLSVVTTELILNKQAVRADVILCDQYDLHCFEIKTAKDTLVRLDRQLETYATHADFITVVAATKHINAVISRVPEYIGIYEMVNFSTLNAVRVVREPQRSPFADVDAMLSLLPVTELQDRLLVSRRLRRREAVAEAITRPAARKKEAVISFIRERYKTNSMMLLRATRRRKIEPRDLVLLRRWRRGSGTQSACDVTVHCPVWHDCNDQATYNHVGRSFGPVPEEVRTLLAG